MANEALRAEEAGEGHLATLTQAKSRLSEPWAFVFREGFCFFLVPLLKQQWMNPG